MENSRIINNWFDEIAKTGVFNSTVVNRSILYRNCQRINSNTDVPQTFRSIPKYKGVEPLWYCGTELRYEEILLAKIMDLETIFILDPALETSKERKSILGQICALSDQSIDSPYKVLCANPDPYDEKFHEHNTRYFLLMIHMQFEHYWETTGQHNQEDNLSADDPSCVYLATLQERYYEYRKFDVRAENADLGFFGRSDIRTLYKNWVKVVKNSEKRGKLGEL